MRKKLLALAEVILVFALAISLIAVVGASSLAARVREVTHLSYLEYLVMIAVLLLLFSALCRDLLRDMHGFQEACFNLPAPQAGFKSEALAVRTAVSALGILCSGQFATWGCPRADRTCGRQA